MPLQFYKPNSFSKGCAGGFSFNSKDGAIFLSLVQQSNWNAAKRTGSFNGAKTNLKLSLTEAGEMIYTFTRNKKWSNYHGFGGVSQTINVEPYITDEKIDGQKTGKQIQTGFGIKVNKKENSKSTGWLLTLTFAESIVITEWLRFALERCFSAIYSQDKKNFEARVKEKEMTQVEPNPEEQETEVPASIFLKDTQDTSNKLVIVEKVPEPENDFGF